MVTWSMDNHIVCWVIVIININSKLSLTYSYLEMLSGFMIIEKFGDADMDGLTLMLLVANLVNTK